MSPYNGMVPWRGCTSIMYQILFIQLNLSYQISLNSYWNICACVHVTLLYRHMHRAWIACTVEDAKSWDHPLEVNDLQQMIMILITLHEGTSLISPNRLLCTVPSPSENFIIQRIFSTQIIISFIHCYDDFELFF